MEKRLLISVVEMIFLLYLIEIPVPQPVDYISRNLQRERVDAMVLTQRHLGYEMGFFWATGPLCSASGRGFRTRYQFKGGGFEDSVLLGCVLNPRALAGFCVPVLYILEIYVNGSTMDLPSCVVI
jgi:hypothetical protein